MVLCGISSVFTEIFPILREVSHVLLTRLPLTLTMLCKNSLDLHVLGTPPALTLSQDQTLHKNPYPATLPHRERRRTGSPCQALQALNYSLVATTAATGGCHT